MPLSRCIGRLSLQFNNSDMLASGSPRLKGTPGDFNSRSSETSYERRLPSPKGAKAHAKRVVGGGFGVGPGPERYTLLSKPLILLE